MKKNMQICWLSNMQTFTVRIYSTFLFALLPQLALAQFQDDFSDHNFTTSPAWSGNDRLFVISNSRLMLNGGDMDSVAYLATTSNVSDRASWEFTLSFLFNPSGANYARIYLVADQPDLTKSLNGYFVMLGRHKDAISLYKQTGLTQSEIIRGSDDLLNHSSIDANVKVTRDDNGWKLFTDITGNGEYVLEGTSNDDTHAASSYFGVVCTYTSTRADKFSFDNFNVSEGVASDNVPPALTGIDVVSSTEVKLTFSEPLEKESATNFENYLIDDSYNPTDAILADDQRTVLLIFPEALSEKSYTIILSGIIDLNGNRIAAIHEEFVYIAPSSAAPKDVIISEIFADPSPRIGLGDAEFVELYNRSDTVFDMSGWAFSDGSSVAVLPAFALPPRAYLILAPENAVEDIDVALFLNGFPSLNNNGDALVLKDNLGNTIDSVNYTDSWFRDAEKESGGWTLEIIDPDNLCSGHENWAASEDERGGTPGASNSILANKPDLRGPKLTSASLVDSVTLKLRFNETLKKPLSTDLIITIDPTIGIDEVRFANAALTELEVFTSDEIHKGIIYSVSIANVNDCSGNVIQEEGSRLIFGTPQDADSLDILVNEILFNPRPTGVDFVEILNNSSKFINLGGWSISNTDKNDNVLLADVDLILAPDEYLAITSDAAVLKGEYIQSSEENFLQLKDLPSFNDDSGSVALVNNEGKTIDSFRYSKEMHSAFIKVEEGVSLERISKSASDNTQNWKSASASVGFATPGYINSNVVDFELASEPITTVPEIFNPLSGQPNFTTIHYNFDQGGYVANVRIFDAEGRVIKELANNDILGTKGFYRWDGDCNDGSKASLGSYMILFEVFNDEGTVKRYRCRVAVASAFD